MRKIENSISSKNEVSLWKKGLAGLVAAAALSACSNGGGEAKATPNPETIVTVTEDVEPVVESPTPSETASTTPDTQPGSDVGFSAETFKDPEQLNNAFYSQYNDWMNTGYTEEQLSSDDYWDLTKEDFINKFAEPADNEYIDAMFVADWQENPNLVEWVSGTEDVHRFIMDIAYITSDPQYDSEQFKQYHYATSTEVQIDTSDTKRIASNWVISDNTDKNRGIEFMQGGSNAGETGGSIVTYNLVDGFWKISDIQYNAQ